MASGRPIKRVTAIHSIKTKSNKVGSKFHSILSCQLLSVWAQLCPAPFSLQAGKCVFVSTAQSHSWCSANWQCESIGGELLNSYSSLKLLGSMPGINCNCWLWLGVTDMADERERSNSGWQMINGRGPLPVNESLWTQLDPNNNGGFQDCVSTGNGNPARIADLVCSDSQGFVCEFVDEATAQSLSDRSWQQTPFKRTSYNPSSESCYTDMLQGKNAMHCVAAAMRAGNSRHVLYNSKLGACRLLLFTDAQVEEEIETSADWVKFSVF